MKARIAKEFLVTLFYADYTGLEEDDIELFDRWEAKQGNPIWDCPDPDDSDLTKCEITGLLSECVTIEAYYP